MTIQYRIGDATSPQADGEWIIEIEDVSEFVAEQRSLVETSKLDHLMTPAEVVYPVEHDVAIQIGLA